MKCLGDGCWAYSCRLPERLFHGLTAALLGASCMTGGMGEPLPRSSWHGNRHFTGHWSRLSHHHNHPGGNCAFDLSPGRDTWGGWGEGRRNRWQCPYVRLRKEKQGEVKSQLSNLETLQRHLAEMKQGVTSELIPERLAPAPEDTYTAPHIRHSRDQAKRHWGARCGSRRSRFMLLANSPSSRNSLSGQRDKLKTMCKACFGTKVARGWYGIQGKTGFVACAFGVISPQIIVKSSVMKLPPVFCYRNFMVFGLMLRSLIHFELNFENGVKKCPSSLSRVLTFSFPSVACGRDCPFLTAWHWLLARSHLTMYRRI